MPPCLQLRDHLIREVVQALLQTLRVSQGLGADFLIEKKATYGLDNLMVLGFQPFEALPEVLATADVLMAVLEPALILGLAVVIAAIILSVVMAILSINDLAF